MLSVSVLIKIYKYLQPADTFLEFAKDPLTILQNIVDEYDNERCDYYTQYHIDVRLTAQTLQQDYYSLYKISNKIKYGKVGDLLDGF